MTHSSITCSISVLTSGDYEKCVSKYGRLFLWAPQFYSPILMFQRRVEQLAIERVAGPFDEFMASQSIVELKV